MNHARLAQWQSDSFTPSRSWVRSPQRAPKQNPQPEKIVFQNEQKEATTEEIKEEVEKKEIIIPEEVPIKVSEDIKPQEVEKEAKTKILYPSKRLTPQGNMKIVVVEFKLIDDPKADFYYEFYCNVEDCVFRTPDQDTKYFTDWCGENCKIDKKSFFGVFNNPEGTTNIYPISKDKVSHSYYSIYKLKEFYESEAKKYGVDLNISLDIKGPYTLSGKPPQRLRDGSPNALEKFFDQEAQKHNIDITNYDIVNYLYFTSENYLVGTVSEKKTFNQAFISFDEFFSSIMGIVHEMGHIFGAPDTYEPGSWSCEYPKGYPETNKTPLYPQSKACLMCKSIMIGEQESRVPKNFSDLVTCDEEAKAFGWK